MTERQKPSQSDQSGMPQDAMDTVRKIIPIFEASDVTEIEFQSGEF
jgi:hypothetical protein